jgi:hypothetical protein
MMQNISEQQIKEAFQKYVKEIKIKWDKEDRRKVYVTFTLEFPDPYQAEQYIHNAKIMYGFSTAK